MAWAKQFPNGMYHEVLDGVPGAIEGNFDANGLFTPVVTPAPTPTPTPIPSPTPAATATPVTPTITPSPSYTPVSTPEPSYMQRIGRGIRDLSIKAWNGIKSHKRHALAVVLATTLIPPVYSSLRKEYHLQTSPIYSGEMVLRVNDKDDESPRKITYDRSGKTETIEIYGHDGKLEERLVDSDGDGTIGNRKDDKVVVYQDGWQIEFSNDSVTDYEGRRFDLKDGKNVNENLVKLKDNRINVGNNNYRYVLGKVREGLTDKFFVDELRTPDKPTYLIR